MKNNDFFLLRLPLVGKILKRIYYRFFNHPKSFRGSENFWIQRYNAGGNSGPGSYNKLAEFKAEIINTFVQNNQIKTVVDFGCGDGNQLQLAKYPSYIGFDVSPKAISMCQELFMDDTSKVFKLTNQYAGEKGELAISLDVIFHLVEDKVFNTYMERLFNASSRFVIIYASNFEDNNTNRTPQLKHRNFSKWIEENCRQWKLIDHIPNRYPLRNDPYNESFSEFFIYEKQ